MIDPQTAQDLQFVLWKLIQKFGWKVLLRQLTKLAVRGANRTHRQSEYTELARALSDLSIRTSLDLGKAGEK